MYRIAVVILGIACIPAFTQQAKGPLTNERIGGLVLAGVSESEIVRIISSAPSVNFDLRPNSTDELLKVGVSEDIIKAMAARESGQATSDNPVVPSSRAVPSRAVQVLPVSSVAVAPSRPKTSAQPTVSVSSSPESSPVATHAEAGGMEIGNTRIPVNSRLYIEPNEGFDTFLTAALSKKHVPVDVVADQSRADYVIESANDSQRAGWARIIALGQTGSNEEASVRIVRVASGDIVWAYAVHKRNSFHGKQSSAEACAKHLKKVVR